MRQILHYKYEDFLGGTLMAFFHIHKKEEPHYTLNIEKFLVDNSIPYDLDDTEDIMKLSYLNPLDEETYVFFFAEDKY